MAVLLRLLAGEGNGRAQRECVVCASLAAIGGPGVVRGLLDVLDQVAADRSGYTAVLVLDALARLGPREAVNAAQTKAQVERANAG
ncbi:hypothetical protein AB0C93_37215 [Streptomyces sp. NPDC048518]|uniref:hypothetical protein n=1 Tax=Streptomyces sp. NPDC048518 TaxID=3155029 RepID=UPI0033D06B5D